MKFTKHSGAAHLVIATIILALGLVGALGYVVWDKVVDKDQENSSTNREETNRPDLDANEPASSESLDEIAGWTKLDTGYFSMPVPDGWKLQRNVISETNKDFGFIIAPYGMSVKQALTYSKGVKASIETVKESQYSGHGISSSLTINYVAVIRGEDGSAPLEDNGYTKVSTFMSTGGIGIDKYHKYFSKRPAEMIEGPIVDGSNVYVYRFKINNMTVQVDYAVAPNDQVDNTAQLEQALKAIVY